MFFQVIDGFGLSLYQMCMLFVVWSFLGWAIEVCAHTVKMGEYSNRGFLSMPICPIYGVGVLILTIVLRPVMSSAFLVFLFSMIICTAFELFVGVMMKVLFHNIWWDYSDEKFNFKGYICLKVSLEWGLGGLIVVMHVVPFTEKLIDLVPHTVGIIFLAVMLILIIIDTVNSVAAVTRLNMRLKEISEISEKMYDIAQYIGKNLGDTALEAAEKGAETAAAYHEAKENIREDIDNIKENAEEKSAETLERLRARMDALAAFRDKGTARLIKAYPTLRSVDYGDALDKIRKKLRRES